MYRMCGERETVGMCDVSQPVQEKWLQEQGLRIEKSDGDGHCMYRSVACNLNPDIAALGRNEFGIIIAQSERPIEEAAAISLRNRVASYMESHWDEFPTVLEEER